MSKASLNSCPLYRKKQINENYKKFRKRVDFFIDLMTILEKTREGCKQ